jgi:hypothetical protein
MSGGGIRAASLSLGFIRALRKLGIFQRARYLSTNSGGSWISGPLSFMPEEDIDEYLGEYCPPDECTMTFLSQRLGPKAAATCIAENFVGKLLMEKLERPLANLTGDYRDFWSRNVGEIFFQPFGMDDCDHIPIMQGVSTDHSTPSHAVGLMRDRPYPIINACVIVNAPSVPYCPLEFTPLYYGVPVKVPSSTDANVFIGDSFTEPVGFASQLDASMAEAIAAKAASSPPGLMMATVPVPSKVISVSESVGISSSYLAQSFLRTSSEVVAEIVDFPVHDYWSPCTGFAGPLRYCDGGGCDNTGNKLIIIFN